MKNSTALITGGAKRIGREISLFLASQGYDLVVSYNKSKIDAQKLAAEIATKYRVKCDIFKADISDLKQVQKLADFTKKNSKNWNLLINNASIFNKSKFISGSDSDLAENLNIHFFSPLKLSHEFAKNSPQNGQIINMVDKNIARFDTNYFHYLLSKKFLAETTKMLALELAPEIRVNAVAPGFILNSIDEKNPSEETKKLTKKIPLQKKGEIENIVQSIEFLLGNDFINGQIIFVDGGASLNHAG